MIPQKLVMTMNGTALGDNDMLMWAGSNIHRTKLYIDAGLTEITYCILAYNYHRIKVLY